MTSIYESPDGGRTIYERDVGSDPASRRLVSTTERLDSWHQERLWRDIRQAAESDRDLAELLERVQVYYTLKHG